MRRTDAAHRMCSTVVAYSRHEAVTHWPPFEMKEPLRQKPNGRDTILPVHSQHSKLISH